MSCRLRPMLPAHSPASIAVLVTRCTHWLSIGCRRAELTVAAAAWPRSAEELDALLLDFGTWEFYVADMTAMAAALAEAAAAEARVPLPRMPQPAPLVVTLGRHLLGYATAAGWRRVAARLRADLSWMGLGEVARGVPEAQEGLQEMEAAGQQQEPTADVSAAAPAPAASGTLGTGGDVSPGGDTAAAARSAALAAGEVAGGTPADSGSGTKQGPLRRASEDAAVAAVATAAAGDTLGGPPFCGLQRGSPAGAAGIHSGAGGSTGSSSVAWAGDWGSSSKGDGSRKGTLDAAGTEARLEGAAAEDDVDAFHRFADAVALQQGHM
jgi:hypothetical protein